MTTGRRIIWIADDEAETRSYLADFLTGLGYSVQCFESGEQITRRLPLSEEPSLLLLDLRMPRVGGMEVLVELNRCGCRIPAIVLSGLNHIPAVVRAMRLGALDYLVKPFDEEDLKDAVGKALEEHALVAEAAWQAAGVIFRTTNKRMLQIRSVCDRVAPADVPVLILGETGVGKEVLARYIHAQSGRSDAFVKVNCAALPGELLESELFGHERGAFTGALREKPGKFELAGQGTIFLDEVGEMSPLLQAKLLHVLQDGEYCRLGGTRPLRSEARVVAATNKDLQSLVRSGGFREDLYFRLNVITVEVPPLRARREDIRPLSTTFVERYRGKYQSRVEQLPPELLAAFERFSWPGNIRQLENAVKRYLILPSLPEALTEVQEFQAQRSPAPPRSLSLKESAASAAEKTEKELIFRTLNEVNWNRKQAAQRLNICYKSLLNKLHRWQLAQEPAILTSESGGAESGTKVRTAGGS